VENFDFGQQYTGVKFRKLSGWSSYSSVCKNL